MGLKRQVLHFVITPGEVFRYFYDFYVAGLFISLAVIATRCLGLLWAADSDVGSLAVCTGGTFHLYSQAVPANIGDSVAMRHFLPP